MNRREASKLQTRNLILKAAKKLFHENGVEKTTMRAIAIAAGVSPASVVVHFKNKIGLLEVVLHEDIETTMSKAIEQAPPDTDLMGLASMIPWAMFSFYEKDKPLYSALIRNTIIENPENCPHLHRQMIEYVGRWVDLVDLEKAKGRVRADIDSKIAAEAFTALYFGVLTQFFSRPEMTAATATEKLTAMTGQYLTGILTEGKTDGQNP